MPLGAAPQEQTRVSKTTKRLVAPNAKDNVPDLRTRTGPQCFQETNTNHLRQFFDSRGTKLRQLSQPPEDKTQKPRVGCVAFAAVAYRPAVIETAKVSPSVLVTFQVSPTACLVSGEQLGGGALGSVGARQIVAPPSFSVHLP